MYDVFASYYDKLTSNIDYAARAQFFDSLIRENLTVTPETILLDLGCGTGSLTAELAKIGYDMIGVDASPAMLSGAMSKGIMNTQFIMQDFTTLDLYGTVDVTVCALDCLNHLRSVADLEETIRRVALFTAPGGLFIFDVNTPYKHKEVLANNTFVYDLDNIYCVWQNATDEATLKTEITLDFFIPCGEVYRREQEVFCERVWQDTLLQELLDRHGYHLVTLCAGDVRRTPKETDQRVVYIAQKLK